jgi:hypothetical protein
MNEKTSRRKNGLIFSLGQKNEVYAQYFVRQSCLKTLVADQKVNVSVGNVNFEQGAEITGIFIGAVFSFC